MSHPFSSSSSRRESWLRTSDAELEELGVTRGDLNASLVVAVCGLVLVLIVTVGACTEHSSRTGRKQTDLTEQGIQQPLQSSEVRD